MDCAKHQTNHLDILRIGARTDRVEDRRLACAESIRSTYGWRAHQFVLYAASVQPCTGILVRLALLFKVSRVPFSENAKC